MIALNICISKLQARITSSHKLMHSSLGYRTILAKLLFNASSRLRQPGFVTYQFDFDSSEIIVV